MIRKMKITEKEILEYIARYIAKHCYAPSHTEIAEDLDISPGTVKKHIKNLLDSGILETDAAPGTQRAIRIRNTYVTKRRKHE